MDYSLKEIAVLTGSAFSGTDLRVRRVVTDSRGTFNTVETLFIAIRGGNHNGHAYIGELYERGVRAFLIDSQVDEKSFPEAGFVRSVNSLEALQKLAAYHRSQFKGRVVAITGSNGKTVTKEWIAQLCPPALKLFRSPKSYNSQIGVPLSLLMLEGDEDLAVIEAGISRPGEMQRLEAMIRPQIGIFTNLGDAHQENFLSLEQKLKEKLALFDRAETIIYLNRHELVARTIEKRFDDRRLVGVDVRPDEMASLPYPDEASRENAAEALALYEVLGYERGDMLARLSALQPVAMRLELKEGTGGCKLINDSYNSDINSLSLALDYLATVSGGQEKLLILSDIRQSGLSPDKLYAQVAEMLKTKGVDQLIGIGDEISRQAHRFDMKKHFYATTDEFLRHQDRSRFLHKSILIKGSRDFHFEKISHALENKIHTTVLEVNLDHMIHNLNYFRSLLRPGIRTMAMVKALGYGNGTYEVASMLQHQGVSFLAVAFADEGVVLREAGITMPIVVLNADADSFEPMIEHRLEPEIYSFASLKAFAEAAARQGETHYPIHIKLDTGMHRLGFEEKDVPALIEALKVQPDLYVSTIFSHLAASDEPQHDDFTRTQIARYKRMSDRLLAAFPRQGIIRHLDNSAGIERFPEAQFDMVRLGVGLYGISAVHQANLLPVATLKTRIVQIKELEPGETVGYGRHGLIERSSRTATVPIGYADGLNRHLGRGAWKMIVRGQKVPIIGNICMDTCMLDITGVDAREGDPVVIFGEGASVIDMAGVLGTIPYEVMTSVSTRVKRVYIKE